MSFMSGSASRTSPSRPLVSQHFPALLEQPNQGILEEAFDTLLPRDDRRKVLDRKSIRIRIERITCHNG
jgi:hypothetical protein